MKREKNVRKYISKEDNVTYMLSILEAICKENASYNWLITDIEAYPNKEKYDKLIKEEPYLFLSTSELLTMLKEENFQWIWGVFSAISSSYSLREVLKCPLPSCRKVDNEKDILSHPLAVIEIVSVDSSYVIFSSWDEEISDVFKKEYPKALEIL